MSGPRMRYRHHPGEIGVEAGLEFVGAVHRGRGPALGLGCRDLGHQLRREFRIVAVPGQLEQQAERHLTGADPRRGDLGHPGAIDREHPVQVVGVQPLDRRRQRSGHGAPYPEVDIPSVVGGV